MSVWILGRATPMIDVSMMTMNCARAMTASAAQRRGCAVGISSFRAASGGLCRDSQSLRGLGDKALQLAAVNGPREPAAPGRTPADLGPAAVHRGEGHLGRVVAQR